MTDLEYHNRQQHFDYIGYLKDGELVLQCKYCSYKTNKLSEITMKTVQFLKVDHAMPTLSQL